MQLEDRSGVSNVSGRREVEAEDALGPGHESDHLVPIDMFKRNRNGGKRSEEHTSELQSLMRISYAVFCLQQKTTKQTNVNRYTNTFNLLRQLTDPPNKHTR